MARRAYCRVRVSRGIESIEGLVVFGEPKLGLFIYGGRDIEIHAVWERMMARGWFSPPLDDPTSIHLMLSPSHSAVVDDYLHDLRDVVADVRSSAATGEHVRAQYN